MPEIIASLEALVGGLERPPILIGHSAGGVFTQILLDHGFGAAGVAINSAPTEGVPVVPLSQIRATFPVLKNPANRHRAVGFTFEQWHYAFTNTFSEERSRELYERYHIPASGSIFWGSALANIHPGKDDNHVDYDNGDRAPLLFISGSEDHLMPPKVQRSNAKKYKADTITEVVEFEGPHLLPAREGWEEVADHALDLGEGARRAVHAGVSGVRVTHVGGPTVLIEAAGWRLLTDPTFDPPGRSYRFGWGSGSRKLAGPAIDAADLGRIDAVLLTHDHHGDNLDPAGRALLPAAGVVVTTVPGAARLGGATRGLAPWETTRLDAPGRPAIDVTATPCRHGPPLSRPIVGEVIGFALRWDGQEHGVLWISGDTVLYEGVREVAGRLAVDVALLHLGGVQFPITGPLRYTMTARDAVALCELVRPRTVVPVHYEGWKHFREGRAAIEREFATAPGPIRDSVRWIELGETADV